MSFYNYEGDLGEYPFFSLYGISERFQLSKSIIFTTNSKSRLENNGAFVLTNDAVGFISKSIFGLKQYHIFGLSEVLDIRLSGYSLSIVEKQNLAPKFVQGRKKYFKEKWGNSYIPLSGRIIDEAPSMNGYVVHKQEMDLHFSSPQKAEHIYILINFQIGANSAYEEHKKLMAS